MNGDDAKPPFRVYRGRGDEAADPIEERARANAAEGERERERSSRSLGLRMRTMAQRQIGFSRSENFFTFSRSSSMARWP